MLCGFDKEKTMVKFFLCVVAFISVFLVNRVEALDAVSFVAKKDLQDEYVKKIAEKKIEDAIQEEKFEEKKVVQEDASSLVNKETEELLSEKEKRLAKRRAEIAEERANEKSRFKRKAIENTEKREKKYDEMMKRKQEKASRFQKKAAEEQKKDKKKKND